MCEKLCISVILQFLRKRSRGGCSEKDETFGWTERTKSAGRRKHYVIRRKVSAVRLNHKLYPQHATEGSESSEHGAADKTF